MNADAVEYAPYFVAYSGTDDRDRVMIESAYELRYQVYCEECKFLDKDAYPERRETDEYDEESAHFYSYNLRRELVGYVRLVPPDVEGRFPWQNYCRPFDDGYALPPPGQSAEISRLMVRRDYRRRRGDLLSGVNVGGNDGSGRPIEDRRHEAPQILLSLYRQMYQHSRRVGIRYWYAAMEQSLSRSLKFFGFNAHQIGPETDYFGPVAPYVMDLDRLEAEVGASNPSLLSWIQTPAVANG